MISVSHASQQTDLAWPASLESSRQHDGLFQTRTEDAPVSMSGRLVADDSSSEELLWRGPIAKTSDVRIFEISNRIE